MVGLCDVMLVFLAQRAGNAGWWHDSIREEIWPDTWRTINSFWIIGWVHPNDRERQVKRTSVLKESAERNIIGLFPRAGGDWSGDLMIADNEDLQESEASDIHVKRFKSQEVFTKGENDFPCPNGTLDVLIVQDRHCQQRWTSSWMMMLKSKNATKSSETQKIRGLWVENLYFDIMKNFVWSHSRPIEIRRRNETNSHEYMQCLWTYYQWFMYRSEGGRSFWGVDWEYKIPDPACKTSWRIQVGKMVDLRKFKRLPDQTANGLKHGHNYQRNKKKQRLQKGQNKMPNCKQHAATEDSTRYWPTTRITSRWLLTLVWNWPKTLLVLCGDSRRESQAIVTSVDASEEQSDSENTGSCGKAKRPQMDHIVEKGYVGSCHYGSIHELVFIQEALKIPEAKSHSG